MMLQLRFLSVLNCCADVQGWTEIIYWSIQVFIAPLMQHWQTFAPSRHLFDMMFDKEPISFLNQKGCN